MPYINFTTNVKVEDADALQKELGEAIRLIPEKTPEVTMIQIDDEKGLFYAGSDEPCAMVVTQVSFGTDQSNVKVYGDAVIDLIAKRLSIPTPRIYVNVIAMDNWFVKK